MQVYSLADAYAQGYRLCGQGNLGYRKGYKLEKGGEKGKWTNRHNINIMHPNLPLGVSEVFYPPESM
jgi:hypothetical protein